MSSFLLDESGAGAETSTEAADQVSATETTTEGDTTGQDPVVEPEATPAETETETETPDESAKLVPLGDVHKQRELKREARKDAENLRLENARLQGMLQAGHVQTQQAKEPEIDDTDWYTDPKNTVEKFVSEALKKRDTEHQTKTIVASAERAAAKYEDYDDVEKVFIAAAQENPALGAQMRQHHDPAEFAYKYGKIYTQAQQYGGDPVKMAAAMEADVRVKLEAEYAKKFAIQQAENSPKTLAGATGAGKTVAAQSNSQLDDVCGPLG